jgi:hypothetical protein
MRSETESSGDLKAPDDGRAYEALRRWHAQYDSVASWTQQTCARCKQVGTIVGDGLCGGCHADRQWTLMNRALCDLLHRRLPQQAGRAPGSGYDWSCGNAGPARTESGSPPRARPRPVGDIERFARGATSRR